MRSVLKRINLHAFIYIAGLYIMPHLYLDIENHKKFKHSLYYVECDMNLQDVFI